MASVSLFRLVLAAALLGLSLQAAALPVRSIPNLASITFYERTGGVAPTPYTFLVNGSELTTRLADPLGAGNHDIPGAVSEYYDVYYSNADGSFNIDGEYLSIEGVFLEGLPEGGGLNLAEIGLNFSGGGGEFGNFVASFVALGNNAVPGDVGLAIDGNLQTHTTMGNTIGQNQRLRVTLGFLSSSGPVNGNGHPIEVPALSSWMSALLAGLVASLAFVVIRRRKAR